MKKVRDILSKAAKWFLPNSMPLFWKKLIVSFVLLISQISFCLCQCLLKDRKGCGGDPMDCTALDFPPLDLPTGKSQEIRK